MAQLGILQAAIDCHNKEDLLSVQLILYLYLSRAERKHYRGTVAERRFFELLVS